LGRPSAIVLCALLIGALAGCGTEEPPANEIVIAQTSQPALDPALSADVGSREPLWLVYTPLLTYRHAEGTDGAELIPGLATDLPEISDDGTTYELELRDQLAYSDGTEVKPSDFEHTIKRVLALEGGGPGLYDGIAGAREYRRSGDPDADISGIETNDETGKVTITLTEPDATFSNMLAMSFAGLVPGDTPFEDMSADPPAGVGPYEITESSPNRQFVLERVPDFEAMDIPDIPTGNIDEITTRIVPSEREQAQDVLADEIDYMQDPPPADLRPTVLAQAGDRFTEHPTVSTDYFFLDHRTAPFDDPRVRAAVNYGLDRSGLARIYAGTLKPGCAFLAPGMPGYDEELDTSECPYGDPEEPPDLDRARELIADAGASGARVTVWGGDEDATRAATETYAEMLNDIGLVPAVTARRARAQTGIQVSFADFPHPLAFYARIDFDDSVLDEELDRLRSQPELEEVEKEWKVLDRYLVEPGQSHLAPFGHKEVATFLSDRIEPKSAIFHPLYRNDYSSWDLKEGA
jgi:peptide/nickel transport system substrate-binding protein